MSVLRLFWMLSTAALLATCAMGCVDAPECGMGERLQDGACVEVSYLQVHLDERRDVRNGGDRQGIGVNACHYRRDDVDTLVDNATIDGGNCVTVQFAGGSTATPEPLSAGGIIAYLPQPLLLSKPDDASCYEAQLDAERSTLYADSDDGAAFWVEVLGGTELEPQHHLLRTPPSFSVEHDAALSVGDAFHLTWNDVDTPASHVLVVVRAYDEDADLSTHAVCFFDDDGAGDIPASFLAPVLDANDDDDTATIYALRQQWVHAEPADVDLTVELFASRSVASEVSLP